ncbi:hypothetical protein [Leucobacter iarius]|uniref:Uncharacterized protein n=1 Tax=Leucobacter iarius TaxID=333963 RepID=A0ABN2L7J1_9MICO
MHQRNRPVRILTRRLAGHPDAGHPVAARPGSRHRAAILAVAALAAAIPLGLTVPAAAHAIPAAPLQPASSAEQIQTHVALILSKQRASGAIMHGSGGINPYFGNSAALGLLAAARAGIAAPDAVVGATRWYDWVLAHLNRAGDAKGLAYTIDDYRLQGDAEIATGSYDSVDSYAATTLSVAAALHASGDPAAQQRVAGSIGDLEHVAALLTHAAPQGVRKSSGLTQATSTYNVGYLMDNAEVFAGLRDFAGLEHALGRTAQAASAEHWAETTRTAILRMWNDKTGTWNDYDRHAATLTGAFYPQGMAQIFPVLHGVVPSGDARAVRAWQSVTAAWPGWRSSGFGMASPVATFAATAALMGDPAGAHAMIDDFTARYAPGWGIPSSCDAASCATGWWYPSASGWTIRALVAAG